MRLESYMHRRLPLGNQQTLDELRNPALRPQEPQESLPANLAQFVPASPVDLDKQVFGDVLREARRGNSAGIFGNRNEYLKLCLEDDVAFNALFEVSQRLARAEVPELIVEALRVSASGNSHCFYDANISF